MREHLHIGFTYDLRDEYLAAGYSPEEAAEFDKPETIDAIEAVIASLGHKVDRIGSLKPLVRRLAAGDRWDLVFNIAEGMRGPGREAQVPALLEAYDIPVTFGDSLCLAVCLHKGHSKHIVSDQGYSTPRFALVEDDKIDYGAVDLRPPLFVKPVAEGTGKGINAKALVRSRGDLKGVCEELLSLHRQPVLVEEYLPGREFTVGIIGTGRKARTLGVMEVVLLDNAEPGAYTFENKDKYLDRVTYRLVDDGEAKQAADLALAAYRGLGCRDAGRVDLRSDANNRPNFMEVNPLAGLNPTHSDLPILCRLAGIGYETLIAGIVESASERLPAGEG